MLSYSWENETCPWCGSTGNCVSHGSYMRSMADFTHGKTVYWEICVLRLYCTSCGHTHAILPDVIISYSVYGLFLFFCALMTQWPRSLEKNLKMFQNFLTNAAHNGSNDLNGHCFVSVMLCVPVWNKNRIHYLSVPPGYRMWQKKESKLELAASMVRQVMPEFSNKKNVLILCDSWYVKKNLVSIVDEYENPDLIGNAGSDSVIYDLPQQRTGKRGRPALHGKKLSIQDDFTLSDEKIGDYYMTVRHVLTNIFGKRTVLAYVTSADKATGSRRLFFSTIFRNSFRSSAHGRRNPR